MTSETDYPRQRTVAELLAEHGGGAPSGRRRRRRAAEDVDSEVADPAPVATDLQVAEPGWPDPDPEPDRSVLRDPVPDDPTVGVASSWESSAPAGYGPLSGTPRREPRIDPDPDAPPAVRPFAPARPPRVESPTEQIPLISDGAPTRGVGHTGPMERLRRANPRWRDALDVVQRGEQESPPPDQLVRDQLDDGGPPTQAGAPLDLDELDGPDERRDERYDRRYGVDAPDADALDADDDELYDDDLYDDEVEDDADDEQWSEHADGVDRRAAADAGEVDLQPRRRLGRASARPGATGPTWALVLTQWIVGALGGAALWVGFRFLWRSLPVVALAAAAVITAGLIMLVWGLLRSKDWRTTGLAVLLGLLLTVSPALLVLLDR